MGELAFAEESITASIMDELHPHFELHHAEIEPTRAELKVDREAYIQLGDLGAMKLFVARKDGQVVGYNAFMVRMHPHSKSSCHALQDVLFIHPEHRGFGMAFLSWCDEQLFNYGVDVVYRSVSFKQDHSVMLERKGYREIERLWMKERDNG